MLWSLGVVLLLCFSFKLSFLVTVSCLVSATNWQRIGADKRRRSSDSSLQRRHRSHRLLPGGPERHPAAAQQFQRGRAGDPVLAAAESRRHGADGRAIRADSPRAQPLLRDHVSEQTCFLFLARFSMFLIYDQFAFANYRVRLLLYGCFHESKMLYRSKWKVQISGMQTCQIHFCNLKLWYLLVKIVFLLYFIYMYIIAFVVRVV